MKLKIYLATGFVALLSLFLLTENLVQAQEKANVCTDVKENTAVFWAGDGKLRDSGLHINEEGHIGIGTSEPPRKLTVFDGSILTQSSDNSKNMGWQIYTVPKAHSGNLEGSLSFHENTKSDYTGSHKMVIAPGGNVGIGTTSPKAKLDVKVRDGNWIIKGLGNQGGDYIESVVLLHEAVDDKKLGENFVNGKIIARRGHSGAWNRKSLAEINTSSAYRSNRGSIRTITSERNSQGDWPKWQLVTVKYEGIKYMAVRLPYADAYFGDGGLIFEGYYSSTAPHALKLIDYYKHQGKKILNKEIKNSMRKFTKYGEEYLDVRHLSISGNLGLGVKVPSQKLEVNGEALAKRWNTSSDLRLKTDLKEMDNALEKIKKLTAYYYKFKDKMDKEEVGLIAQEVQKVLPEVVSQDADGYLSLDYGRLTPLLINGVKELEIKNEELKVKNEKLEEQTNQKINKLKRENKKLKERVDQLEGQIEIIYEKLEN